MKKIVIASGYFNPLHIGHIKYLRGASLLGSELIVIVNSDGQVRMKGNTPFMSLKERMEIIRELKCVDYVVASIDNDKTQRKSIRFLGELIGERNILIFAKGGDSMRENTPELSICKKYNIDVRFGVGGEKIQSSSWLIKGKKC